MWGEAQKCLVLCGKMAFPNLTGHFKKLKKLQKLQFLQPRILMDQCLKFPKAEFDRGIWSHILIFPVDRVAGSGWRRIEERGHMKLFLPEKHTEDGSRNDRPVVGSSEQKFQRGGLIQGNMGRNGVPKPVVMPVIILDRPGKVELFRRIQRLRGDRSSRIMECGSTNQNHRFTEHWLQNEILSVQITVDETDIIAVVGDALVDDMGLSGGEF